MKYLSREDFKSGMRVFQRSERHALALKDEQIIKIGKLLLAGNTQTQIAKEMNLSLRCVNKYMRRLGLKTIRKVLCSCGVCHRCKNRLYMRKYYKTHKGRWKAKRAS